ARDGERRDLRSHREAPLRDDHPEAEPDAAHGALPAPLPARAPPLRHGEDGPRATGGGRAGAGEGRQGETARRSEREPVSDCGAWRRRTAPSDPPLRIGPPGHGLGARVAVGPHPPPAPPLTPPGPRPAPTAAAHP